MRNLNNKLGFCADFCSGECDGYFKEKYPELYKDVFNEDGDDRAIIGYSFAWSAWQAAKAQAVPKKTVKLHLVWNENKDECVGFLDSKDARYTATGDDRGMFGVTALGDYFRDLNDERNEFETQIVMIEAQEPAND